jgi:hypothetical protein
VDGVGYALAELIPATYHVDYSGWTDKYSGGIGTVELHTATVLNDGQTIITTGGNTGSGGRTNVYAKDGVSGVVTSKASLPALSWGAAASLLQDGKVCVTGGNNTLISNRVYDSTANTWSTKANLPATRSAHGQTTLADGTVFIAGGSGTLTSTSYDPIANTYTAKASLPATASRTYLTDFPMVTLQNGKVLTVGGNSYTDECDLYNPSTNSWTVDTPYIGYTYSAAAGLLIDGRVIAMGGYGQSQATALYDPSTSTWTSISGSMPMSVMHYKHSISIISALDDYLWILGGNNTSVTLSNAWGGRVASDIPIKGRKNLLAYLASKN